ncbi:flagellar assembly protein FliW [Bacillus mesophilum]|uniref:Flagellar assembly factor FliW n=1 Tax=Bacillus mesophilum TaxID=1071718 RepID=A0A7V7RM81_9BACI|nr:flagellar assembly protein FliW [Bacillus mesophilum]KAB2333038.1 flagellar assembly protein FliW [Bacillus mesophilum]
MKLATKYQGEQEINENQVIQFHSGIPGFQDETQFALLPFLEDMPYFILQSTQTAELAFVVVDPYPFFPDYQYELPEAIVDSLQIESPNDVATFVILTLKEPFSDSTANLKGPIVINVKKNEGKQLILNDVQYKTKHLLFSASTKEES